jgi:hypothetical protein
MVLDPRLDILEFEAEMPAEAVVGDGIGVASRRSAVDEGLGDADQARYFLDRDEARVERELELTDAVARLIPSCHAAPLELGGRNQSSPRRRRFFGFQG